jgi:hypothetical protein
MGSARHREIRWLARRDLPNTAVVPTTTSDLHYPGEFSPIGSQIRPVVSFCIAGRLMLWLAQEIPAMNSVGLAAVFFAACNSVRVLAYFPQIARLVRDWKGGKGSPV